MDIETCQIMKNSVFMVPDGFPASAQSANCHACIRRVTPTITNCTGLTTTQLGTVDSVIHGVKLFAGIDDYLSKDPAGFRCVSAMMWDIVRYRGHLWSNCLNPTTACPWAEMMQYLTMIPKIASIYGAQNPPAAILVDPPK
ncbi:hypothetical protein EDD11_009800 [Mortierella claussenii]|nr:hypothetical protein EDD11_009800 [Mortierella claussenii]